MVQIDDRTRTSGVCSKCGARRKLTDGKINLHQRYDVHCDGSLLPPVPTFERGGSWGKARRAAIARDGGCLKCGASDGLDVHHIVEQVFGGGDELENLATLCSDCHCEWTFCEPTNLEFRLWIDVPPARRLAVLFAAIWPSDVSAETFRQLAFDAFLGDREKRRAAK